jgi:hypothetical protein
MLLLLAAAPVRAYETDQFSNRLQPIADSTVLLNREVNTALAEVIEEWRGPKDEREFANAIYRKLGGVHWVDQIERWAMKSPEVAKLDTPRHDSIYAHHPFSATRVTGLIGVGSTIRVNGQLIGTDKLGHFISQGRKFWWRWLRFEDEGEAAAHSAYTERAIFGQMTTGDYSNADLVANYEGHRFYRSLFENDITPGKPAIVRWRDGGWVLQREFDWSDHVNAYWDEALNPNHFDERLYPHMRDRFLTFCGDYAKDPAAWTIPPATDQQLAGKYAMLQLRDTSDLRLPNLCRDGASSMAGHTD